MAINPETQFVGKITPSSVDYPYGEARNVSTPGDGTGTPWLAVLVNDLFGWQQALLSAVGVVPTGNPDKVGASQYLGAMVKLSGKKFDSVAAMVADDTLEVGDRVHTMGYYAPGDGGANTFAIVAAATGTDDGGTYIDLTTHQAEGLFLLGVSNAKQYGARGDNSTLDTTAIFNYGQAKEELYFPDGMYLTGTVIFPSTVRSMSGPGATLIASGTIATHTQLLTFQNNSHLNIHDIAINIDNAVYPTVVNLVLSACLNSNVLRVVTGITGKMGMILSNCVDTTVEDCAIVDWQQMGILVTGASSRDNTISRNRVFGDGASHGIQCTLGNNETVEGNYVEGATVFGISLFQVGRSKVINNSTVNTVKEGINAHEASDAIISGNRCYWSGTQSIDFGISVFTPAGDVATIGTLVTGNKVTRAGKSGIGIAQDVNHIQVTNNVITNCNLMNAAEEHGGIVLYGSGATDNVIRGNSIQDYLGNHKYGVFEWDGVVLGDPSGNKVYDNEIVGFTVEEVKLLSATSKTDVWRAHTPVITAAAGTITTAAATGIFRVVNDKSCEFHFEIDITTNGTGATAVLASLPFAIRTAIVNAMSVGIEHALTGYTLSGLIVGSGVQLRNYDATYPGADGASMTVSGSYPID